MMQRIAIHGVPRSGTSWIGSIFDSSPEVCYRYQPLFSHAFKGFLNENSSADEIQSFFEKIMISSDDYLTQRVAKKTGSMPSFEKVKPRHVVYKEARYHHFLKNLLQRDKHLKVIGVVRNPKAVIASWFKAPKEFDSASWNLQTEWRLASSKNENRPEQFYGFEKWKEVTQLFLAFANDYANRFYLLEYDKLLTQTKSEVSNIFEFCNIPMTAPTLDFLRQSRSIDLSDNAYSVYRIRSTDDIWERTLPKEISHEIDEELKGTELERFII